MRTVEDHKINPANDQINIIVTDEPGSGGANHQYKLEAGEYPSMLAINFQNGPIAETGINGVTHEALLAIVADRLRSFQAGPFSSKYNELALVHVEGALHWLKLRTTDRINRGVEGLSAA